jgi:hypothetical protein
MPQISTGVGDTGGNFAAGPRPFWDSQELGDILKKI